MTATILASTDAPAVDLDGLGVRFLIGRERTDGRFALVEHPLAPRTLGAPMHTHTHEDEYSFVLTGTVGVRIADEEFELRPGQLVFKPRAVPHAFWNATDEPARLLEIISPGGFERFFLELDELLARDGQPDEQAIHALMNRYGIDMDFASGRDLAARHRLRNEF